LSEQPIPETCSASGTRSGQLLGFLFGLAPDGVFRASAIALGAVGSYPAFSPLPLTEASGGLSFCGTFRRKAFRPSSRIYPPPCGRGYAASRPVEFGLSSPSLRWKRFSALPKSPIIYLFAGSMASPRWQTNVKGGEGKSDFELGLEVLTERQSPILINPSFQRGGRQTQASLQPFLTVSRLASMGTRSGAGSAKGRGRKPLKRLR
jgi:hypothetical protein